MRILGARIFSKFFGGKIEDFQTNVNKLELLKIFKKNGACVFWAPVFFLSLLAGKLEPFEYKLHGEIFAHNKCTEIVWKSYLINDSTLENMIFE